MEDILPLRESADLDAGMPWLKHIGDSDYFSKLLGNWPEVSRLSPLERMLSEAAFGIVCHHGIFDTKVVFSKTIKHEFLTTREPGRLEIEIRSDYSGKTFSQLLKFVRYAVYTSLGIDYIPDVHCFSDVICPTPRNTAYNHVTAYRNFKDEADRRKHIIWSPKGEHKDLLDSVQRLLDSGLITPDDIRDSRFAWSSEAVDDRLGWCSLGLGVVFLNKVFDRPDVEDEVVDFIIYHECLHLRQRFRQNPVTGEHDQQFRKWESRYPNMHFWDGRASIIANS